MKRIVIASLILAVSAAGILYSVYPDESKDYLTVAAKESLWLWDGIKSNPVPVALAMSTFLLTVVYHKAKGKSLRESVEVAATRVALVTVPADTEDENPVVKRAKARATRSQLLADQIALENRQRKLPDEVVKAEKDACYTEHAVADAKRKLADKQKLHDEAMLRLQALRNEKAAADAELAEIETELEKLAELV